VENSQNNRFDFVVVVVVFVVVVVIDVVVVVIDVVVVCFSIVIFFFLLIHILFVLKITTNYFFSWICYGNPRNLLVTVLKVYYK